MPRYAAVSIGISPDQSRGAEVALLFGMIFLELVTKLFDRRVHGVELIDQIAEIKIGVIVAAGVFCLRAGALAVAFDSAEQGV
jgi:hypothetical protein